MDTHRRGWNMSAFLMRDSVLTSESYENRRIVLLNYAVITSIFVLLIFICIYSIFNFRLYFPAILTLLLILPVFVVAGISNQRGYHKFSAIVFNFFLYLCVGFPVFFFLGNRPGVHFHMLYFSLLPILTLPVRSKGFMAFFILLNQVSFFLIESNYVRPISPLAMTDTVITVFRAVSIISSLLATATIIIINQYLLYTSEKKTSNQNKQLNELNKDLQDKKLQIENQSEEISKQNHDLKQLTDELSRKLSELENLHSSRDNVFRVIAHDLRGPVGNIESISDMIIFKSGDMSQEKVFKFVDLIKRESSQVLNTLDRMLRWADRQRDQVSFNPQRQKLSPIINEAVSLLSLSASIKRLNINLNIGKDICIKADKDLIGVVIRNLLNNAIKYSLPGSRIWIDAGESEMFTTISVRDEGIGIAEDRKRQLFSGEFLESVPGTNSESGSGIGLKICKNYMDQHNGAIWVESKENKGSTFFFSLPVCKEQKVEEEDLSYRRKV